MRKRLVPLFLPLLPFLLGAVPASSHTSGQDLSRIAQAIVNLLQIAMALGGLSIAGGLLLSAT